MTYPRIKLVHSFEELVTTPFGPEVNALCWQRTLDGDFDEVMRHIKSPGALDEDALNRLRPRLTPAGNLAIDTLIEDLRRLHNRGLDPLVDCITSYPRDEDAVLPVDVYSFHADRAPVEACTYLCTYAGAPTEGLRNDQSQKHIDIPATRARLEKLFEGEPGTFADFLKDNCFDLHYAAAQGAQPFSFGLHNLWRLAIEHPGCPVPPCIHRAPETAVPRLILIS